ncbi:hypothetical protein ACHAWF_016002 [Thalassiosira exigua]
MADDQEGGIPQPPLDPHFDESAEPQDAAAAAAAAAADGEIQSIALEENLRKLQEQQIEQTQLIMGMQSMINHLSAKQTELEGELDDLKNGRWVVKAEPRPRRTAKRETLATVKDHVPRASSTPSAATPASLLVPTPVPGIAETTDEQIDVIIESLKERKMWPLKRKYCIGFTQEDELFKIRFHRSARYTHMSVRIPKVDSSDGQYGHGNKEGRLICRLCSGRTVNRNTSWMCATCCVPLCADVANGDPETSCHYRWHTCQDLVSVNATLNTALRERRESKKRSRESMDALEEEEALPHHQAPVAAPESVKTEPDPTTHLV